MVSERVGLSRYEVIGAELALGWEDGSESYVPLRTLRLRCPCALCAGERDLLGRELPGSAPTRTDASFRLTRCVAVGGYALQPTWADGHGSGIYSHAYLKALADPPAP